MSESQEVTDSSQAITLALIDECLQLVHAIFEEHGIWYCITYGTLLGAIRDEDLIGWDYDFDLFVRREQLPRILALNEVSGDLQFEKQTRTPDCLAVNPGEVTGTFETNLIEVSHRGHRVGDLYYFTLFRDGVLRRFDHEQGVYWCPRCSFPHFFVMELEEASIRGRWYPTMQYPEKFLEGVYGPDWQTPYRAVKQGGSPRPGVTIYGDRYEPKLRQEILWCKERGWDQLQYASAPSWPPEIRGAGPIGPTERTVGNSRSLWWRDYDELVGFF